MISDNALTFKTASRHIARVLKKPEVKKFLSLKRVIVLNGMVIVLNGMVIVLNGMVIVESEGMIPRSLWTLGRVEKRHKSRDEKVRGSVVRVGREDGSRCYERPSKLYPLEVNYELKAAEQERVTTDDDDTRSVRRSRRTAAIVGNQRRQLVDQWLNETE